jgi:hypothetical protein
VYHYCKYKEILVPQFHTGIDLFRYDMDSVPPLRSTNCLILYDTGARIAVAFFRVSVQNCSQISTFRMSV